MRLVRRNTTLFEYIPFSNEMSDLNENGLHTGDFVSVPSEPVTYRGTISAAGGNESNELFGTDIRYTHTLVMDDPDVDISELGTIRWEGNMYEIRAVVPTINTLSVALRRKTANNARPAVNPEAVDGEGGN